VKLSPVARVSLVACLVLLAACEGSARGTDAGTDAPATVDASLRDSPAVVDSQAPDGSPPPTDGGGLPARFPGATWDRRTPEEAGLSSTALDALRDHVGGRAVVVRGGTIVYGWGDEARRADVASAAKPIYAHFLYEAVEEGRIASVDALVVDTEPRLGSINAALGFKDREMRWRHLANQTSCYGVSESPGTAFDYNDWQMALFWDSLFLGVYGSSYAGVDADVFQDRLCAIIRCEDDPTFMAFGTGDRPGRVAISVRDFARFGLLYLHEGTWDGTQIIPRDVARMAVASPLPGAFPRTTAIEAEMIPGRRTIGSSSVPDDQTDHMGSYSWLWWTNGVDRSGVRHWPDAPEDTYGAFGHGGPRAMIVIPSLDLILSWNDATVNSRDAENEALRRLVAAVL